MRCQGLQGADESALWVCAAISGLCMQTDLNLVQGSKLLKLGHHVLFSLVHRTWGWCLALHASQLGRRCLKMVRIGIRVLHMGKVICLESARSRWFIVAVWLTGILQLAVG